MSESKTTKKAAEAAEKARKAPAAKDDGSYPVTIPLQNGGIYYHDKKTHRTIRMRPNEIPAWLETLEDPELSKVTAELEGWKATGWVTDNDFEVWREQAAA